MGHSRLFHAARWHLKVRNMGWWDHTVHAADGTWRVTKIWWWSFCHMIYPGWHPNKARDALLNLADWMRRWNSGS